MTTNTIAPATLDDLYRVEGKAELVAGRIVQQVPSGFRPNRVALKIVMSLETYSINRGVGVVLTDGMGFALRPPLSNGRQSFSPDASYYVGPLPADEMRFVDGAPTFAVEVRSENDYGPAAEIEMRLKRRDYFEAGTLIVWDVDPRARMIASYHGDPAIPTDVYQVGDVATAEPAVPGWQLVAAKLFE